MLNINQCNIEGKKKVERIGKKSHVGKNSFLNKVKIPILQVRMIHAVSTCNKKRL